jgi:hypothetical protein
MFTRKAEKKSPQTSGCLNGSNKVQNKSKKRKPQFENDSSNSDHNYDVYDDDHIEGYSYESDDDHSYIKSHSST